MSKPYGDLPSIWYRAYWAIRVYLDPYLDIETCTAAAAKACGLWFRLAADGEATPYGAYHALYSSAREVLVMRLGMGLNASDKDLNERIPLYADQLPCDLARTYALIWQGTQLAGWDRRTINLVSKTVGVTWLRDEAVWTSLEPGLCDGPVPSLVRCAFDVIREHSCTDNPVCTRSALIWEREDMANDRWLQEQRLAREGI